MQKISLAWLPKIFESYKNGIKMQNNSYHKILNSLSFVPEKEHLNRIAEERWTTILNDNDFKQKTDASDELLEIIKNFIKETNELTKD